METTAPLTKFAINVKARRKSLKLTQGQLAKLAGLSQTTISDVERGRNETSAAIVHLAKALRCTAESLMGEENFVEMSAEEHAALMPLVAERQAAKTADMIRSTLELAGFSGEALGSKKEIIARLTGDALHTKPEKPDIPPGGGVHQNDGQLPDATGHGDDFKATSRKQKKSPKLSEGDG